MAINIVDYINSQEPVASWTTVKKQEMLDRFCEARGYDEGSGLTKAQFMDKDILNYIKVMVDGNAREEAINALIYDEIAFD